MNVQVEEKRAYVPTSGGSMAEAETLDAVIANGNGDGEDDPEDKPDALPLFEVRIEGIGPLAIEAVSQAALVDYVTNLAYTESPTVFFPFRVEYLKAVVDGQPVVDRSIIYLDPSRIIVIGPERIPLAYVKPDPAFSFEGTGESGPVEVIVLADETEDGASSFDDASPKGDGGGEDGPE